MDIDPSNWAKVNELLDEVLERPGSEREAWLQSLNETHSDYEPILRRMLSHSAEFETSDFLELLPSIDVAISQPPSFNQRVGPYRLIRKLGAGGMASVWFAERSDGLIDRPVALKLPHPSISDVFVERAERERDLLALLNHANIARLYDAGVTAGGQPYLALEYVEGSPITEYADANGLDIRGRLELFASVIDAMTHAHAQLIIHRDIKPSNVLVTPNGEVRLVDFGIAKLLEQGNATATELTLVGGSALTLAYAAPEHIRGEALSVAADVYSLGVLLFELLSGQRPHADVTESSAALEQAVLHDPPKRPSDATSSRQGRRALQGDLDVIVLKALAKEPERRYRTCHALGEDLKRYLSNEPVSARPDGVGYRLRKFVARHRAAVITSTFVAMALIAATVVTVFQSVEATRQRNVAMYQQQRASATMAFMSQVLDGVSADGTGLTMPELLDRAVSMLDTQYRSQPFLASLYESVAARYLGIMQTDQGLKLLGVAEQLAREQNDTDVLADILCFTGRVQLRSVGNPERATKILDEAKLVLATLRSPSRTTYVQCARALAWLDGYHGDGEAKINRLQAAAEYLENDPATTALSKATVLNDLAVTFGQEGRFVEQIDTAELAISAMEAGGRVDTVGWLTLQSNLAVSMNATGEVSAALELREKVQNRASELEIKGYSIVGYGTSYGSNLYAMGYFDRSLTVLRDTRLAANAAGNNLVAAVCDQLEGRTLTALGQPHEAMEYIDRAAQFFVSTNRESNIANVDIIRAEAEIEIGNLEAAEELIASVLEKKGYGPATRGRATSLALVIAARIALERSDGEVAEKYANDAYAATLESARDPATNASVGRALLFRGKARLMLGKPKLAREDIERALAALTAGAHAEHPYALEAAMLLEEVAGNN